MLRDKLRNADIRSELGVKGTLQYVEEMQQRWYGHVMRMLDGYLPHRLLHWRPNSTRPPGHHKNNGLTILRRLCTAEAAHWLMWRVPAFWRTDFAGETSQTGLWPTCKTVQGTRSLICLWIFWTWRLFSWIRCDSEIKAHSGEIQDITEKRFRRPPRPPVNFSQFIVIN